MNTTTGAGAPRRNTCGGDDMLLGWPEDAAEPYARARSACRRTALAPAHPVEELARFVCRSRWEEISEQVLPEQYLPERIAGGDVQELLRRVDVRPDPDLSRPFPEQHSARARLRLRDGRVLEREQHDCEGFHTRPMSWDAVAAKSSGSPHATPGPGLRAEIGDAVRRLDEIEVDELTRLLATPRTSDSMKQP